MKVSKETKEKIRQEAGKLSMQWVKAQYEPFALTLTELAYAFGVKILERYGQEVVEARGKNYENEFKIEKR